MDARRGQHSCGRAALVTVLGLALAGCVGGRVGFPALESPRPPQPAPAMLQPAPATGSQPQILINAPSKRVQDTIIARAQTRGTNIVGANLTGVTLEVPLNQSSELVVQQCGPHEPGRTIRVYLETVGAGNTTTVTERRFIVDGGSRSCELSLPPGDVDQANRSLADLKTQAERPARTAQRPPSGDLPPPGNDGLRRIQ
jgi:hypothetical protein